MPVQEGNIQTVLRNLSHNLEFYFIKRGPEKPAV